jgi:hypothetical protein
MALEALIPLLMFGGLAVFWLVVVGGMYVYMGLTFSAIARKTRTEPTWLAWIPVANIYLLLKCAQMSPWWILAFFVPLLNAVAMIMAFWKVCERLHKPGALSLLLLVPLANIILLGYLAWSK